MIPKILHYVWVGGKPMPERVLQDIASWCRFCPDYEVKLWNEKNFDINSVPCAPLASINFYLNV
jgi:mannosyltransferase OCH1-like enzyme